jgi:hypothetical protein
MGHLAGASILCRDGRGKKIINSEVGGADLKCCSSPPHNVQSNRICRDSVVGLFSSFVRQV